MKSPVILVPAILASLAGASQAFVLVAFDMETVTANASATINQSATASTVQPSVTVETLDAVPNGSTSPGDFGFPSTFESSQWSTFSHRGLSGTPFWEFTVTPEVGETISLTSFSFDAHSIMTLAGGTAEVDYVLRWSGDSFASPLATIGGPQANATDREVVVTGLTADLSSLAPQTSAFAFRLEAVNLGGTNGTWSQRGGGIDNLTLNAVPEPSVAVLGAFGILALVRRRRG